MAAGKISELVDENALAQLDALYKKLGITTQAMIDGTSAAINYNNAIANTKTLSDFTAANEKATESMQGVKEAQQQVNAIQKEATAQTQIVVEAVKAKAIAEIDASKILLQLNGTTEANIKLLVEQKAQLNQINTELKEHSKVTALSSQSIEAHKNKTVQLTKAQLELKESTAQLNLLIKQQTKEQLAAATSNDYLIAQLNQARKAYNGLSQEERDSSAEGKELLQTIELLTIATKQQNEAQGKFTDNVGNYALAQGKATESTGKAGKSFDLLDKVMSRVNSQFIRMIAHFALITIAFGVIEWIYNMVKNLDIFTGRLDQTVQNLKALNEVQKEVANNAGESIGKFRILSDTIKDGNSSYEQRLRAANELKKLWPEELAHSSAQAIANGEEKDSLDKLTDSVVKLAKAKAAANQIEKVEGEIIALQIQRDKDNSAKADLIDKVRIKSKKDFAAALEFEAKNYGKIPPTQKEIANAYNKYQLQQTNAVEQGIKKRTDLANKDIADQIAIKENTIKYLEQYGGLQNEAESIEGKPKKGPKDKTNTEELENIKARLEREKALAKIILDDENQSYEARIKALKVFIDRSNQLIDTELKIADSVSGISKTAKDTNAVKADTQRDQLQIDQIQQYEKLNKERSEKLKSALEEMLSGEKDLAEKAISIAQDQSNEQILILDKQKSKEELILAEKFAKKKIDEKKYHDELLKINDQYNIDRLGQIAFFEQAKLEILQAKENSDVAFAEGHGADANKIADIKSKSGVSQQQNTVDKAGISLQDALTKQTLDNANSDNHDLTKKQKDEIDLIKDLQQVQDEASKIVQANYENELRLLERKSQQLTENANVEKAQVEAGVGSQRTKALKIAQIEADAASQRKAIAMEEAKIKQKEAIANRAGAIASIIENTAIAAMKVIGQTGIFGLALEPIVIALGAAQLAATLATPLPKFKTGTTNSPEGLAHVGESGAELRIDPSGKMSFTPSTDTITYLKKGTKIISNEELIKMVGKPEQINYVGGQAIDINKVIDAQKETTKAIKGLNTQRRGQGLSKSEGWNSYLNRIGVN